jgi:ribosomal protein L29
MSDKKENLSREDSKREILEEKKKLLTLRFRKRSGDVKDTSVFSKTRKAIARLFTQLNRRGCKNGSNY